MVTGMEGDRARSALRSTRFADLSWVAQTGSTNADLVSRAASGASDGTVLVAEEQTAGKGRVGREWESPPGSSLLFSVLLRPGIEPERTFAVTAAMAVSAVEACALVVPLRVGIKWPNDLVVVGEGSYDGLKLAGMLAEAVFEGDRLAGVVTGLGINVNWPTPMPEHLEARATSLNHVVGHRIDREDLLTELLRRLDVWASELDHAPGRAKLMERYRMVSSTIGQRVRVEMHDGPLEGQALEVDDTGRLKVLVDGEDEPRDFLVGDVVHLRSA